MASARAEWKRALPLPFTALLGVAGPAMFGYSSGVMMEPITAEFGWTRSEFYSAVTLQMMLGLVMIPVVGRAIDRLGSRRLALTGVILFTCGVSSLFFLTNPLWHWLAMNVLVLLSGALVVQPVWIRPVVMRFDKARGLAMAIALSGNGVATALWPVVAAYYVKELGWRLTYPAMGLSWALITFPLVWLYFHDDEKALDASTPAERPVETSAVPVLPALASPAFLFLTVAGALFSCAVYGLTLHFVPILRSNGIATQTAAGIASLVGISAIVGRIVTGALLDRFPAGLIGFIVFLLPALTCVLLWAGGISTPVLMLAAIVLGLAAGAEIDVVTYLAARRFDTRIFGSLYAVIIAVFGACASIGPLTAGLLFDRFGSYQPYLTLGGGLAMVSAMLMIVAAREPKDRLAA